MTGKARGSPTTRGVKDVADRVCRLNKFVSWGNVRPVLFEEMVPRQMCGATIGTSLPPLWTRCA